MYDVLDKQVSNDTSSEIYSTVAEDNFPKHLVSESTSQLSQTGHFFTNKGSYDVYWDSKILDCGKIEKNSCLSINKIAYKSGIAHSCK